MKLLGLMNMFVKPQKETASKEIVDSQNIQYSVQY